jgi:hypothetical protein
MNSDQYERLLPVFGVATYLSFFSLDPLLSVLGNRFGFEIPVGLVSFLVGFVLFMFIFVSEKRSLQNHLVVISVLFFGLYVNTVVIISTAQTPGDNYIMTRYLSFFAIGYYTTKYINKYNKNNHILGIAYFTIMVATLYAVGGREYFSRPGSVNYLRVSEGVAYTGLFFIATSKKFCISNNSCPMHGIAMVFYISIVLLFVHGNVISHNFLECEK